MEKARALFESETNLGFGASIEEYTFAANAFTPLCSAGEREAISVKDYLDNETTNSIQVYLPFYLSGAPICLSEKGRENSAGFDLVTLKSKCLLDGLDLLTQVQLPAVI